MENVFLDLLTAVWRLCRPVLTALSPLLTGLVLAYLLDPLVRWLTPHLGKRLAIACAYLLFFGTVLGFLIGFVLLITGALPTGGIRETLHSITAYFSDSYEAAAGVLTRLFPSLEDRLTADGLANWLAGKILPGDPEARLSALGSGLVNLFLGVVASVYLIKDKDLFLRLWGRFLSLLLPQRIHGLVSELLSDIHGVLTTFIKGALLDSLLVAFLSSAVLSLLGVNLAVVIGILGGLLNIIPYFGPFFGMIPAFLVALLHGGPGLAVSAVLGLVLVQQVDSNLLYPRIVGATTGLHPLFVLLSVSIMGHLMGILGMILAVPLAGILQIFIKKWAYR